MTPPVTGPLPSAGSKLIEPSGIGWPSKVTSPLIAILPLPQPTPVKTTVQSKTTGRDIAHLGEPLEVTSQNFTAARRGQRPPGDQADVVAGEPHAAVSQQDVHPAGMPAAGRHGHELGAAAGKGAD